jgi:hypothetical protein
MRGIVIAKTFTLALWGLYLAIGLTQSTGDVGSESRVAACDGKHWLER